MHMYTSVLEFHPELLHTSGSMDETWLVPWPWDGSHAGCNRCGRVNIFSEHAQRSRFRKIPWALLQLRRLAQFQVVTKQMHDFDRVRLSKLATYGECSSLCTCRIESNANLKFTDAL